MIIVSDLYYSPISIGTGSGYIGLLCLTESGISPHLEKKNMQTKRKHHFPKIIDIRMDMEGNARGFTKKLKNMPKKRLRIMIFPSNSSTFYSM